MNIAIVINNPDITRGAQVKFLLPNLKNEINQLYQLQIILIR